MKNYALKFVAFTLIVAGMPVACCQAQDSTLTSFKAKNAIYLELGGTSVIYSLNYDRLFKNYTKWYLGGRAGVSLLNLSLKDSRLVGEFYALKGTRNHYLELGLGAIYRMSRELTGEQMTNGQTGTYKISDPATISLVPRIGYRFQRFSRGLVFRAALTPLLYSEDQQIKVTPFGGLSIGRSF